MIAGRAPSAKELLEQDTHLTHVFVPVGGGGLAAGCGGLHRQLLPDVKVIGVEAEGPPASRRRWRPASRSIWSWSPLFADGWRSSASAGDLPPVQPVSGRGGDRLQRPDLRRAERHLRRLPRHRRAVGALSLAGLKAYSEREQVKGGGWRPFCPAPT